MELEKNSLPPSYTEIFTEIGRQLQVRKSALMKRILLITWPFLLLTVLLTLLEDTDNLMGKISGSVDVLIISWFFFSVCYAMIVRFIFKFEKLIWIDSFFDKINLLSSESWKIARKLFWQGFVFRLKLWFRYYAIPQIVALGGSIWLIIELFNLFSTGNNSPFVWGLLGTLVVLAVSFFAYRYYLKTKLRYAYFIFLDSFGGGASFRSVILEMEKLNNISASDAFKKSLAINIGTESIDLAIKSVIATISGAVRFEGKVGKAAGDMTRVYVGEAGRQVTEFANIAGQYLLYRFARKELYGTEQKVNNRLYELAGRGDLSSINTSEIV